MKKLSQLLTLSCLIIFLFSSKTFSANEYFRTITSGDWNSTSTWEMSLNNSTWFPATSTPDNTSNDITIQSPHIVTVTANVSADEFTINNGGTLTINNGITFTLQNGPGNDFTLNDTGTVNGSGIFRTQGDVILNIRDNSFFLADLEINTGTAQVSELASPYNARIYGNVTVDAGAILYSDNTSSYTLYIYGSITNNGEITGAGGNNNVRLYGPSLINNGTITSPIFNFDSVCTISGNGSFTGGDIIVGENGVASLLNDVTFSPASEFKINTGGIFSANNNILTITSGDNLIFNGGTILNSGTIKTQGDVSFNLRAGSAFMAPLVINSGITDIREFSSPYIARIYGSITIDNGASLYTGNTASYDLEAYGAVTNNGTIYGVSSEFVMMGPSFANNGSVEGNCRFDSVSTITGSGSFTSQFISIGINGNITLLSNVTFSPGNIFTVKSGGVLNINLNILTFNSGQFQMLSGSTVLNSGTFRTQDNVVLDLRGGSSFNAPLNVNSGTTDAREFVSPYKARLYGTLTVDNGATLYTGNTSSYDLEVYNIVTNNGTINGVSSEFVLRGPAITNNGSISGNFRMDSTCTVTGTGTFTGPNINANTFTLLSDISFSPSNTMLINSGSIIDINSNILTVNSGTFVLSSGATILNSGTFKTQGTVDINVRGGSNFNAPLLINTGITNVRDYSPPYLARMYGPVTIDSGSTMYIGNTGSYDLEMFNNIVNNGTIDGSTSAELYFESGSHSFQGEGKCEVPVIIRSGATVTMLSDHEFYSTNIISGGTFDITNMKIGFTRSDPILQEGTFNTSNSTIVYNGTTLQNVSFNNIVYDGLRIINPNGARLNSDLTIPDTLAVLLGYLELNGNIITITPSGNLYETPGNVVRGNAGYIITTRDIGTPTALNVGGLGAVLTATSNLGVTEIKRGHTVQTGLNGGTSIKRYYDITPANNSGLNATLVFKFDDTELNGKPEPTLKLFKSTNTGSTWLFEGGNVNIAANSISLTGITSFSRWSADSSMASAAITLAMQGFYNNVTNRLSMSDTIRAYLRNVASPYAIVDSAIGTVDSLTFKTALEFSNAASGTYYIQLNHRNSLETWSKNGVIYQMDSTLNYDFTFAASQSYGDNTIQKGSKYCLYSGDVTQDGFIDLTDVLEIYNNASDFVNGYVVTDVNGDLITDLADVLIGYNNSINFVAAKTPLNP